MSVLHSNDEQMCAKVSRENFHVINNSRQQKSKRVDLKMNEF